MKYSWAAFAGRGSKWEKMVGENARMLPKATHEERKKQEAKRRGKLKTVAGKLLKSVASGKEAAEEKAGSEDVAGNLLKTATSRKGAEGEMPAGNLEVISGSSPGPSLPLPALQALGFISFWSRCFALSSSPSFTQVLVLFELYTCFSGNVCISLSLCLTSISLCCSYFYPCKDSWCVLWERRGTCDWHPVGCDCGVLPQMGRGR